MSYVLRVEGVFWKLKWLDWRPQANSGTLIFGGSSSSGFVSLVPVDVAGDLDAEGAAVELSHIKLIPITDLGQCLCFDFLYMSKNISKVVAGFANGCIAVWVWNNNDVGFDHTCLFHPQIVFPAHISCVNHVVWNLFNSDHFASSSNMTEDSFKVS